ncbi:isocitrate lyase/phosphoenolpyruvate mutase family protein [Myxococcus sp. AM001]|uniref:isocitrate lyase/phosphoenolpyruvate mutase family protein n=1 Tax=Myxococcus vastator TaxID=2709664 RepID=UPI0013D58626|nr:isocitrate lyase/phosphoenolpyruvate mutase family protein [Myxococcus vastator]NVJ10633.1 isocitrate lyase/phosphoenolpyruvate mutase family protein [Myxococcus sp. AM001]
MGNPSKSAVLREKLARPSMMMVAGAHDGLSARLAHETGFDAVWASGFGISAAHCVPDASILTMNDFLDAAISMNEATHLPIIADGDAGFGNVHNLVRMVRKYEAAGIAAVCIEDKVHPKLNSFDEREQVLVSMQEFTNKLRAAKAVQQTQDFVVIARTEALIAGLGMEEALKRAYAYREAGADAILIHSKDKSGKEIVEFAKSWKVPVPLVVVPTKFPTLGREQLEALGFKMAIYANQGLRAAVQATRKAFELIMREGSTLKSEGEMLSMEEIFTLQGMPELVEHEKRFGASSEN